MLRPLRAGRPCWQDHAERAAVPADRRRAARQTSALGPKQQRIVWFYHSEFVHQGAVHVTDYRRALAFFFVKRTCTQDRHSRVGDEGKPSRLMTGFPL
jgi:hypothetical protein